MKLDAESIQPLVKLVCELCGVVLDESKIYLMRSRLGAVVEEAGAKTVDEFCLEARRDPKLKDAIINAITTQETLFFRDNTYYEALRHKAIPETIDAKTKTLFPKRLRFWSAACSTGQEPYSIGMILMDLIPDWADWDIRIVASDISDEALAKASRGEYLEHEVKRGLDPIKTRKFFDKTAEGFRVKDELRSLVHFERRNLLKPFIGTGPFDVVFCRNVSIYFERDERIDLFRRLSDCLTTEGYLFAGSSESLSILDKRFVPEKHCGGSFYRPNLTKSASALAGCASKERTAWEAHERRPSPGL